MFNMSNVDTADTVNSNDKDERLKMSNACMIEENGGPETDTVKSNDKDERLEMSIPCMIEENGGPETDTVQSNDKDERLEMSNACMIEENGGPKTDTVKSNDKDERLEMSNACTIEQNGGPKTDTVKSNDKDERLEMSNACMIEENGGPKTHTVKSNDKDERLEMSNTCMIEQNGGPDESNFYHSAAQVCIQSLSVEEEDRKVLSVNEDESSKIGKGNRKLLLLLDEISTSIRTLLMLLDTMLWVTSSYLCIASIKDENSLNLHGCEVGCYNDIERNGLIIDFKPWLEFGDFTRLRDDILQKIHRCVKKGILIFPDWVHVIWNGKTPIQLKRINKIGEGGIGVVYQQVITDGVFSFIVASKVIPVSKWRNEEAEVLMSLQDCSFVPKLYGVIIRNGNVELLEELMDGKTLSSWHGKNLVDVVVLFISLLQKISVLHKKGLYHQDLKVSNVMVTDPSDPTSVVIIDFGSTIMLDSKRNHKRPITNSLAPPEKRMTYRAIRQSYDERTKRLLVVWDSWSLGIILFYLLTGKTMSLSHDVTQANLNFTREKIRKCIYNMTSRFGEIPDYIRDILIGLIEPDHRRRMTPDMILDMFDREIFICIH